MELEALFNEVADIQSDWANEIKCKYSNLRIPPRSSEKCYIIELVCRNGVDTSGPSFKFRLKTLRLKKFTDPLFYKS